jgi:hypothetical protein
MSLSKTLRHCRLEWRPSGLLQTLYGVLLILTLAAIKFSALAWYWQLFSGLCVIYGAAFTLRKLRHQAAASLFWRAGEAVLILNLAGETQSLSQPRCHRQGPLWIISGNDAAQRTRYFVFLPDNLSHDEQRQLHLVATTPQALE